MKRVAVAALLLAPALALACDSCGGPNNDYPTKWAYEWMSMVLSLLPLAFIGAVIGFIVYRVRKAEQEESAQLARLLMTPASRDSSQAD